MISWNNERIPRVLAGFLTAQSRVFEWGPGASTIFFARFSGHVTSLEHDEQWFKSAKEMLENYQVPKEKVTLLLSPPMPGKPADPANPWSYASDEFPGKSLQKYVQAVAGFAAGYDLIYVDGRARASCLRLAQQCVTPKGVVVLHDAERNEYKAAQNLYAGWQCMEIGDGGPQLNIWTRD